jgi:hypothetical protein
MKNCLFFALCKKYDNVMTLLLTIYLMGGETISHHAEQPKNEALEKHQQAIHSLQASPELQHLPSSLSTFFNKQLR